MCSYVAKIILTLLFIQIGTCKDLIYEPVCRLELVESIPEKLTFNSTIQHLSTFDAYKWLVTGAKKNIDIASFYWTLRNNDTQPPMPNISEKGQELYNLIANTPLSVSIRVAYNGGSGRFGLTDIYELSKRSNVKAVVLNFTQLFGTGVLHTKSIITDNAHAYLGSSNMDWRSLTQIKELGILLTNCPTLVGDLNKLFEVYFMTGKEARVPKTWPSSVIGGINATNPWLGEIEGNRYSIYFGASPPPLSPPYRSRDLDAITSTIEAAKEFVHVAVMDYTAKLTNYASHKATYWSVIDDALRRAAYRGVHVRLLVSHWRHSDPDIARFVQSLTALSKSHVTIEGKFFIVPAFDKEQARIPFARVNHNKYLVTESTAVICTSNWEGSYFYTTAGIAMVLTDKNDKPGQTKSIVTQVQDVFMRDWNSSYAHLKPYSN